MDTTIPMSIHPQWDFRTEEPSDFERVTQLLADRGRNYSIYVRKEKTIVVDRGTVRGKRAKDTEFHFLPTGDYLGSDRPWKAWWLLRGSGVAGISA